MTAIFRHGDPVVANWVADQDRTAGEVFASGGAWPSVVLHVDVKAGEACGVSLKNGIYEMTAAEAIAAFAKVQYVNASGKVAATGDLAFGYTLGGAAGDGSKVLVLHDPLD